MLIAGFQQTFPGPFCGYILPAEDMFADIERTMETRVFLPRSLRSAVRRDDLDLVVEALQNYTIEISRADAATSVLRDAIDASREEIVSILLSHGARTSEQGHPKHRPVLALAIERD